MLDCDKERTTNDWNKNKGNNSGMATACREWALYHVPSTSNTPLQSYESGAVV